MNGKESTTPLIRGPRSDSGMGLAEVMISLVIVATAMLGIAGTSARVGSAVNTAHLRTQALAVARHQVEELLATDYDAVANGAKSAGGVSMNWTITDTGEAKEIVLVYQYDAPGKTRSDTLMAGYREPGS